jgi:pimeloyl-ACP methyl ester carboxylesterase
MCVMSEDLAVFTSSRGKKAVLTAYDTVLSQWGTRFEELDVATSFGQTHVIASGPLDGPPVVLLHAYFATAASWYRTAGALSETYRTLAVDVLGEPNKSRPVRPIRSVDDYGQWFTELAEGLGLTQLHLVGNSMGGFGASYLAMHLAGRVRKLALISPAATFHKIIPFYTHLFLPKAIYLFLPWLPDLHPAMHRVVNWLHAGLPTDGPWAALFYLTMVHGTTQVRVFPRIFHRRRTGTDCGAHAAPDRRPRTGLPAASGKWGGTATPALGADRNHPRRPPRCRDRPARCGEHLPAPVSRTARCRRLASASKVTNLLVSPHGLHEMLIATRP